MQSRILNPPYASFFGIFLSGLAAIPLLPAILVVMHGIEEPGTTEPRTGETDE